MLAAHADCPVPFPQAGSRAFLKDTADPVTILRVNADETAFVRRDARPGQRTSRDASGNTTVALCALFEDADEAAWAGLPQSKRPKQLRSAASGPRSEAEPRSGTTRPRAAAPAAKAKRGGRRAPGA